MRSFIVYALVLVVAGLCAAPAPADCPDFRFVCPGAKRLPPSQGMLGVFAAAGAAAELFTVNTCWNWAHAQCETCVAVVDRALQKCSNPCNAQWRSRADGCSIPVPGVKEIWNEVFHAACDLHDLCYASRGHTQEDCDRWFLVNMKATCGFPGIGSVGIAGCLASADYMYAAVRNEGRKSFDNGQAWARNNCSAP